MSMLTSVLTTTCLSLGLMVTAQAAAPSWKIDSKGSELSFTATENNVQVSGNFASFSGDIKFDPAQLDSSSVNITITMSSVKSSNPDVASSLSDAAWFDPKTYPTATYKSNSISSKGGNAYEANGTLTIRGKSSPVTLAFTMNEFGANRAVASGSTTISRTAFGVGTGEWANTDTVKDEVQVNFKVTATK